MNENQVLAARQESEAEERRRRIGRIYVLLVNLARQKRTFVQATAAASSEPGR